MRFLLKKLFSSIGVQYSIALLIFAYLKFVSLTTKWTYIGTQNIPDADKVIIISWHNRILMTSKLWGGKKHVNFIVSPSKDGRILTRFLKLWGGRAHTGSSGSGTGTNPIKSAVKLLQQNKSFSIAPDGSRGPRYHMKSGVSFLMQKTNADCLITTYNTSRRIVLKSWDNMIVPLPFSKGVVMYDIIKNPIEDKNNTTSSKDMQNALTLVLEKNLTTLTQKSDAYFDQTPIKRAR